ncbi:uncharacterized protein LOC134771895 [Penaeus indicus]|uniref:uncharacterized protein LOC134771895 n=1 Tax=Penaeus indicus TaxID=29960 RepID=UPI00300C00B7
MCEGSSPGRCLMAQQHEPGRHQTTARRTTTRKWSQEENRIVIKCYFESVPSRKGYRKRMLAAWQEREMFIVTEQRLVDQANQIRKKKWLSDLEMEEIQKEVEEGQYREADESTDVLGSETQVDQEQANVALNGGECNAQASEQIEQDIDRPNIDPDGKFVLVEGCETSPEEICTIEKMESILRKEKVRLPPLRGIDRGKVMKAVQKVTAVLAKVVPKDISATNDLLYAGAAVVTEMVGMRNLASSNKREPWWKRRLEKQVRELNIDLGRVNTLIQNGKIKHKYKYDLERRYKVRQKGLKAIKEEIKQRISAKVSKIKRYSSRINQYQQNRVFQNNQKSFFSHLDGEGEQQNEAPDAEQAKEFWSAIWSKEVNHNKDAKRVIRMARTRDRDVITKVNYINQQNYKYKRMQIAPLHRQLGVLEIYNFVVTSYLTIRTGYLP